MSIQFASSYRVQCSGQPVAELNWDVTQKLWTNGRVKLRRRKKKFYLTTEDGELPCQWNGQLISCGQLTVDDAPEAQVPRGNRRRATRKVKGVGTLS